MPRGEAPEGYIDLDLDDYREGHPFKEYQEIILDTAHRIVVRCEDTTTKLLLGAIH